MIVLPAPFPPTVRTCYDRAAFEASAFELEQDGYEVRVSRRGWRDLPSEYEAIQGDRVAAIVRLEIPTITSVR